MTQPTAQAFRFTINGQNQQYDAFMDLVSYESFKALVIRYRAQGATGDEWTFLLGEEFNEAKIGSDADVRAEFNRILTTANGVIENTFGTAGDKPLSGWELVQWYVSVGLQASSNVISLI